MREKAPVPDAAPGAAGAGSTGGIGAAKEIQYGREVKAFHINGLRGESAVREDYHEERSDDDMGGRHGI
jgi:hypothetical protein